MARKRYNQILGCDEPGCRATVRISEFVDYFRDEGEFLCYVVENAIAEGWTFEKDKPELKEGDKCYCPSHNPPPEKTDAVVGRDSN